MWYMNAYWGFLHLAYMSKKEKKINLCDTTEQAFLNCSSTRAIVSAWKSPLD